MQFPHFAPTYAAINALVTVGTETAYESIDRYVTSKDERERDQLVCFVTRGHRHSHSGSWQRERECVCVYVCVESEWSNEWKSERTNY